MVINNVDLLIKSNNLRVSRVESLVIVGLYVVQKTNNVKWVKPIKLFNVVNKRTKTSRVYFYEVLRSLTSKGLLLKKSIGKNHFVLSLNSSNPDMKAIVINSGISYLSEVEQ